MFGNSIKAKVSGAAPMPAQAPQPQASPIDEINAKLDQILQLMQADAQSDQQEQGGQPQQ